ncbi:16S rRNA (guanine(527)-N(7))-methyltransferase RsmG [Kozakia baliensis]|uniref:16S rRNA (guanine(527)-N(7))-methyltransferase RsmG n=1 Tax=Kozakia baliensis TaxID=153496 RepID=UPI00049547AD|nr:16S rRNA (guanine(527)-N(7))-methyltransferase RsmG [Kozakia baliensis]
MTEVSRETRERLQVFADLLTKWNARINLISPRDLPQLWPRHIEDSLRLVPFIPKGERLIDLGSGGGFPGLILGIAAEAKVVLIESDQRKAAFLREAARQCGVEAQVMAMRIEAAKPEPAKFVTARALAPLTQLLAWAQPLLQPDGVALFLKGKNLPTELTEAQCFWHMTHRILNDPRAASDGAIIEISGIKRVE